ncbi:MAG TPA: NAD(P)/FAD-dependent oxidoreductase [Planctomycetes bacterium]|nr:NAD(P)/FAD-dependent oxidoreductase [Planctomycetaceae bacterium]HIN54826.1 NAD(P)/FAD-dependent oxidoreductase [Planctomycetota bacterium]
MPSRSQQYDAIVIGAGAAGLMTAISAAAQNRNVLLLEKNSKPGAKILMSGGTRCNITQNTDIHGIIAAYGKPGRFLHSALAALGPEQLIDFFNERGVPTKCEPSGKVFPQSDRAQDVLHALLESLDQTRIDLKLKHAVTSIKADSAGFSITTDNGTSTAPHVVITSGGKSFPGCGTTGDGYPWSTHFGHRIVPTRPALVPLVTSTDAWPTQLQGITLPDIELIVRNSAGKQLGAQRGSTLFTHFGISGPTAMNLSGIFTAASNTAKLQLEINFLPKLSLVQKKQQLATLFRRTPKKQALTVLGQLLPQRVAEVLLDQSDITHIQKSGEVSKQQTLLIANSLHQLSVIIERTLGYKKAEVTAGGVALDEVNSSTMQSKLQPGLFFAGEILDLDGPIGGYNFQAAFSTGYLAGLNI